MDIARSARNVVLRVLALYLLDAYGATDAEAAKLVEDGKGEIRQKMTFHQWHQEVEKNKANLQVLVLARLIDDATDWIYPDRKGKTEAKEQTQE